MISTELSEHKLLVRPAAWRYASCAKWCQSLTIRHHMMMMQNDKLSRNAEACACDCALLLCLFQIRKQQAIWMWQSRKTRRRNSSSKW